MSTLGKGYTLITGASQGIGRSLALLLAGQNTPLILVSRDEAALNDVQAKCHAAGLKDCLVFKANLADSQDVQHLVHTIIQQNLFVETLINNAGAGLHGAFLNTDPDREHALVELQIQTILTLTRVFLNPMLEQKRGHIINIASVYAFTPVPYQSVYAACKSFLLFFSCSLAYELKATGVRVTTICPGSTHTKFHQRSLGVDPHTERKKPLSSMSASSVAVEIIDFLKKNKKTGQIYIIGSKNRRLMTLLSLVPLRWKSAVLAWVNERRGMNEGPHVPLAQVPTVSPDSKSP